jgi:hypothetical protein
MIAWGANPFQNSLVPLLKNPETKLEVIFKNTQFTNLLRQETADVVAFLTRDSTMERLLQYSLTTELANEENARRFQSMALGILSAGSSRLADAVARNSLLLTRIKQFPESQYCRHPVICGNFSRIVQFLASATNGEILGIELKFLPGFLLQNFDLLGFRELFQHLIVNFTIPFCVSVATAHSILEQIANERMILPVLFLIRDILKAQPDFISLFDDQFSLTTLFKLGIRSYVKWPIVAKEAFSIIGSIFDTKALADRHRFTLPDDFEFHSHINCATTAVLLIFPDEVVHFVPSFFLGTLPTILNSTVKQIVTRLPAIQLSALAEKIHICKLAMDAFVSYSQEKTNGHFLELVRHFSERGIVCCKAHKRHWKSFTQEQLRERYQLVMSNYGGRRGSDAFEIQRDLFQSMDDLYSILAADEDD